MKYNPNKIEKKWQGIWDKIGIYTAKDRVKGKKNFYHLVMFPYPSGDLHIGHWYNFSGADVFARLKRMQGFNVMSPIGFDAFGLPAENAAIKRNIHPKVWTHKNIGTMRKQLRSVGAVYDWSREVITCEPEYYKWTQWMFLQFFKHGLAYRAKVNSNWCPSCKTVLANEQVVNGKCERCDSEVIQKEIEQWLFKITAYAEDLLKDLKDLDWPETTKTMQKNWIGKSEGWEIKFKIKESEKEISVFTTRADTLFGATYVVLAPEHPLIGELKEKIENYKFVEAYIGEARKKMERDRISDLREKTGVELKGISVINPTNGKEIPVFAADYVLMNYGLGAVMAVPAHDQRDFDFAKKHNLPIIETIKPEKQISQLSEKAYEDEGVLVNSGRFDGLKSDVAVDRIGEWLNQQGLAKKTVFYKLRDWTISRQRYWGAPIPMVFCQTCGWQPVKEKDLPVLLPKIKDYNPPGDGKSPLARSEEFVNTTCPKCKKPALRETDTMDTFVCSSWYFLRYTDPKNEKAFASKQKMRLWLPVNIYVGGAEHAVMHLLYVRFFTKALKDFGYLHFKEPFTVLRHQGIILGPDGQKMSKSRGNVVDPDEQIKKYGADVVRMYLFFMGPFNQGGPWNPQGIEGIVRFSAKISGLLEKKRNEFADTDVESLLNLTIKKISEDAENFRFNTAISALMILVNKLQEKEYISTGNLKTLSLLLAPFAPHLAEEMWQGINGKVKQEEFGIKDSVHSQPWPEYDPKLIEKEKIQLIIQINGKVRDTIEADRDMSEKEAKELAFSREKIKQWIEGKDIKKVIFVKGKLINIVI